MQIFSQRHPFILHMMELRSPPDFQEKMAGLLPSAECCKATPSSSAGSPPQTQPVWPGSDPTLLSHHHPMKQKAQGTCVDAKTPCLGMELDRTPWPDHTVWWICKAGTDKKENSMEAPQWTKNRTTAWSSSSTSGYLSGGNEFTKPKRYVHPHAHSSISISIAKTWKQWNERVTKNEERAHTHTHYYSTMKKKEILPLSAAWMALEGINANWNKSAWESKDWVILIICGI